MFKYIFSNTTFDDIKEYENINFLVKKINDTYEISFKLTNSVNFFYYIDEHNNYYLSFNHSDLYDKFGSDNVIRYYKFFEKIILYKNKFECIPCTANIFDIEINSEEGQKIYKEWLNRYSNIIQNINPKDLTIELSAGIDSRSLSYFWRNLNNAYTVYTKNDPDEINEALDVINFINKNFNANLFATTDKNKLNKIKLNGGYIVHGLYVKTTIDDYYHITNNPIKTKKSKHIIMDICPYYDKEFLRLKGYFPGYVKLYLFFNLCKEKDLYKLPIKSFKREGVDIEQLRELLK